MKQSILIPEKTIEHIIEFVRLNISNKDAVTCNIPVVRKDTDNSIVEDVHIPVNALLESEIIAGNLTAANFTGFKKCIKAICAKALKITYTEVTDVL